MSATTSAPAPSLTPPAPPAASTSPSSGGGGGGPTNSPLLFFVALGFGVVFTNLWIIVGVKYCFRYNRRHRRQQQDENGEPIDLVTMPHGPRRRRREKKLMTMEEVNERFPLMKYKAWMTTRAEEGLPTAGGVAAPSASRAASLQNAEGTIERKSADTQRPVSPAAKESIDRRPQTPDPRREEHTLESPNPLNEKSTQLQVKNPEAEPKSARSSDLRPTHTNDSAGDELDDDDDDQIRMAVPTEMMATPGDSCAICIDTLEDDDDVRGLICGHAFHASCLDPWLTSRRACCPLCKADYYVAKPRPEGEAAAETERQSGRRAPGHRTDMLHPPQSAFLGGGPRRPRLFPARFMVVRQDIQATQRYGTNPPQNRQSRGRLAPDANTAPNVNDGGQNDQPAAGGRRFIPRFSVARPHIGVPSFMRRGQRTTPVERGAPEPTSTTPAQLEAGQRS